MNFAAINKRISIIAEHIDDSYDIKILDYDVLFNDKSIFPLELRTYQKRYVKMIIEGKTKKLFFMLPRRAGKDYMFFIAVIIFCLKNRNTNAVYLFPDLKMARNIIWEGVFIDSVEAISHRYIDFVPDKIKKRNHDTLMRMRFKNGSSIRLMGCSSPRKLRGITSNFIMASEFCFMQQYVLGIITPIISSSKGTLLINTTPNGFNKSWLAFLELKKQNDWFVAHETIETLVDDDGNRYIGDGVVRDAISNGYSKSMVRSEFYCECVADETKVIYAEDLRDMEIGEKVYNPKLPIHFCFDLGLNDMTAIIGFQVRIDGGINIVMEYANRNQPWEHYWNKILQMTKNRVIGFLILPHDGAKRSAHTVELQTVIDKFKSFGANVKPLKRPKSLSGLIALVKSYTSTMIIDKSCKDLLVSLNNYQYDDLGKPEHGGTMGHSHYASCFGYVAMAMYFELCRSKNLNRDSIVRYSL